MVLQESAKVIQTTFTRSLNSCKKSFRRCQIWDKQSVGISRGLTFPNACVCHKLHLLAPFGVYTLFQEKKPY